MKVIITDGGVDGLVVTFPEGHYFDTWEEAFEFIQKVIALEYEINARTRLSVLKKEAKTDGKGRA